MPGAAPLPPSAPRPSGWTGEQHAWLTAGAEPGQFSIEVLDPRSRGFGTAYNGLVAVQRLQVAGQALLRLVAAPDALQMIFHLRGVVNGHCQRRPVAAQPGRLLLVQFPGESLAIEYCPPSSEQLWLRLPFSLFRQVMTMYGKQLLEPEPLAQTIQGLEVALLPILEAFVRPAAQADAEAHRLGLQRLEASLMATLVRLIPDVGPPAAAAATPEPDPPGPAAAAGGLCARAQRYMRDHLAADLDLTALALACDTSKRSLQLAFRQELDVTPMQHLRLLRLERLHSLLLDGRSVAEACAQAGLPPTGRTAALYQAQYGQPPSRTRSQARR